MISNPVISCVVQYQGDLQAIGFLLAVIMVLVFDLVALAVMFSGLATEAQRNGEDSAGIDHAAAFLCVALACCYVSRSLFFFFPDDWLLLTGWCSEFRHCLA